MRAFVSALAFIVIMGAIFQVYANIVTLTGTELLGRPTDNSVTVNVVADTALQAYFEYGTSPGVYTGRTGLISATANEPLEAVMTGLEKNMRYYYRMIYSTDGGSTWIPRCEYTFHTQRTSGDEFKFTIIADSHLGWMGSAHVYEQATINVAADSADFHLDLGDAFITNGANSQSTINIIYMNQRPYFGNFAHSTPVFLAIGNHENEEGWNLDDTPFSKALGSIIARKRYFPTPVPDGFYSGNADQIGRAHV